MPLLSYLFLPSLFFFDMGWIRSGKTIHINLLEENVLLHIHSASESKNATEPKQHEL